MFYKNRIIDFLKENLTDRAYMLWDGINKALPDIWEKPTSSTGKYHKKLNGDIPSQAEHVYQMLYATKKLLRIFNIECKTTDSDKLFFAIVLHDSLKYGNLGTRTHSDKEHDRLAANMILSNKETFLKLFSEEQFTLLEETVRFHSGRWSTDAIDKIFSFKDISIEAFFVHLMDMMSTEDLIQTDIRDNDNCEHNTHS